MSIIYYLSTKWTTGVAGSPHYPLFYGKKKHIRVNLHQMKREKLNSRIKGKKAIQIDKWWRVSYPSNSYISIGFSGRRPIFDVSFTFEPVKYSYDYQHLAIRFENYLTCTRCLTKCHREVRKWNERIEPHTS